jgi:hypothetical protein
MELRMRNRLLLRVAAASTMTIAFSFVAQAQSEPQKISKPAKPQTKQQKTATAAKAHKVWTEDDISTVRTPADALIDARDRQATAQTTQTAGDAAAAQSASGKQLAANPSKPTKAPPLSQAKSVEDAEAKIAWEQRDIQGQEESIASLEERLASATPEERAHLQQLIEQHKQYMAESRKEMQGLQEQKKNFQTKPATQAPAAAPAEQPPQ